MQSKRSEFQSVAWREIKDLVRNDFRNLMRRQSRNGLILYPSTISKNCRINQISVARHNDGKPDDDLNATLLEKECWSNACEMMQLGFKVGITYLIYDRPFRHGILHFINYDPQNKAYIDFTPQSSPMGTYLLLGQFDSENGFYEKIEETIECNSKFNRALKTLFSGPQSMKLPSLNVKEEM